MSDVVDVPATATIYFQAQACGQRHRYSEAEGEVGPPGALRPLLTRRGFEASPIVSVAVEAENCRPLSKASGARRKQRGDPIRRRLASWFPDARSRTRFPSGSSAVWRMRSVARFVARAGDAALRRTHCK